MFSYFTEHEFTPCTSCGVSLSREQRALHVCDEERRLAFELFLRRHEIADFERQFRAFLTTDAGRFEVFYAERDRRRASG